MLLIAVQCGFATHVMGVLSRHDGDEDDGHPDKVVIARQTTPLAMTTAVHHPHFGHCPYAFLSVWQTTAPGAGGHPRGGGRMAMPRGHQQACGALLMMRCWVC